MQRKDASRQIGPARGFALFLGTFSFLNLAGELRSRHFDANLWWISFRPLPDSVSRAMLLFASIVLIAFAIRPRCGHIRRRTSSVTVAALLITTLVNAAGFYVLLFRGEIRSTLPVPLSLLIASALMTIFLAIKANFKTATRHDAVEGADEVPIVASCDSRLIEHRYDNNAATRSTRFRNLRSMFATFGICLIVFPILQMFFFGVTDYRRPADAVVVFGARVYADGRLSNAVGDRVAVACELYRQGLAPKLIFSGGPGDGAIHETQAMRTMAMNLGVKDADILLDDRGINTKTTADNTCPLFRTFEFRRVLAVSHFYHLPRVKLAYQRDGWDVYTVPVREPLRGTPIFMVREVAAIWVYYLKPLL